MEVLEYVGEGLRMNWGVAVAGVAIAVSIMGAALLLSFRMGKVMAKFDAFVTQNHEDHERLESEVVRSANITRDHEKRLGRLEGAA